MLLTHDSIAVAVVHVRVRRMATADGRDSMIAGLRAAYPSVSVVIPHGERIHAGCRIWRGCGQDLLGKLKL